MLLVAALALGIDAQDLFDTVNLDIPVGGLI
jgi:hypothetical protein